MLSIVDRYLLRQVFSLLVPILAALVVLYLLVDFAERLDILVDNDASISAALRYFLFKIPLMISQTLPAGVLCAFLLTLVTLARSREIVALHAAGVSSRRLTRSLLGVAAVASCFNFGWNELVVPRLSKEFQRINRMEIRKSGAVAPTAQNGFWLRGSRGIYSVDSFDPSTNSVRGLVIFVPTPDRDPREVFVVDSARWVDGGWQVSSAWHLTPQSDGGVRRERVDPATFVLGDSLNDFYETRVRAEELSYAELRERAESLDRRGLDARHEWIELRLKSAVPMATLALAWVVLPLSARPRRDAGLSWIAGGALAAGFGYWTLLGLSKSMGEAGALTPWVAAWIPNGGFLAIGGALAVTADRRSA